MSLASTIALFILAAAIGGFANYRARQPLELGRIQWVPYLGIQFLAILMMVVMAAHMVSLITGKPFAGRLGP